ncbi:U5 small nuclear ribonucleoprotein TSSC4 [Pseudophryne corroboree]|uniref:U5 small nuclear ribonucleoprotein TSSC4 n=1 Tax=Pseudophryne corroboree TaxID=495146 RepID=UPI00308124B7
MSESEEKDDPPKHFSAFAYDTHLDPGTLSLSESDPELSDDAEVASVTPEEEEEEEVDDVVNPRQGGVQKSFGLPFTLKGTDASFSQRSHGIFEGLQDLQKSSPLPHRNLKQKRKVMTSSLQEVTTLTRENSDSVSAEHEGTESDLLLKSAGRARSTSAKPLVPVGRVPDYLEHPERWTKYSLKDVPDTSDRTNRNTALNFLTELHQRKEAKRVQKKSSTLFYNQDSSSSGEGRILFKRPSKEDQGNKDKSGLHLGPLHMSESWGDEGKEEGDVVVEQAKTEDVGFHGFKKRPRKNIRPKKGEVEEADSP